MSLISAFVVRSVKAEPAFGSDIETATTIFPAQTSGMTFCFNSSEAKCSIALTGPTQLSNIGNATFSGIVTASQFKGDGSELTGVASRDFYGFEVTNENLFVKFTNGGADNISLSENASFVEDFIGPTGYTFSINNAGELEMTI